MTSHAVRTFLLAVCGFASLAGLSPQSAQADPPITFVYRTLIDATPAGGAPDTPLTVTYSFHPYLRPADDSDNSFEGAFYFTRMHARIDLGDEAVESRNALIGVYNGFGSLFDIYRVDVIPENATLLGHDVVACGFGLMDWEGGMFDDAGLPLSPEFALQVDWQRVGLHLMDPLTGETVRLGVTETSETPPEELTPFSLEQVTH